MNDRKSNLPSLVVSIFFIAVALITFYDTLSYGDIDSKVFPRTAATILLIGATISLILQLLNRLPTEEGITFNNWWKRVVLIGTMLVACSVMFYTGFLIASMIAFMGCMFAAKHAHWSIKKTAFNIIFGLIILVGFYALFQYGLDVPLNTF